MIGDTTLAIVTASASAGVKWATTGTVQKIGSEGDAVEDLREHASKLLRDSRNDNAPPPSRWVSQQRRRRGQGTDLAPTGGMRGLASCRPSCEGQGLCPAYSGDFWPLSFGLPPPGLGGARARLAVWLT